MNDRERKYHFKPEHRLGAWIALLVFLGWVLWLFYSQTECPMP